MAYQQTYTENKKRAEIQEQLDMSKVDAIVNRIKRNMKNKGLLVQTILI